MNRVYQVHIFSQGMMCFKVRVCHLVVESTTAVYGIADGPGFRQKGLLVFPLENYSVVTRNLELFFFL